ncbi:MAG TPA: hypothetical protein VGM91_19335 [Conexibacter sp.]|jgi:hypothetical protein
MRAINKRGATIRGEVAVVERILELGVKSPNGEMFVHDGLTMCEALAAAAHVGIDPGPEIRQQTAGFMAFARQSFSEAAIGRNVRASGMSADEAAAAMRAGRHDPFAGIDYPLRAQAERATPETTTAAPPDFGDDFVAIREDEGTRIAHEIADKAFAVFEEAPPPPGEVLRILQLGLMAVRNIQGRDLSDLPRDVVIPAQTIARMGFNVRLVEFESYRAAREADLSFMEAFEEWVSDPEFGGTDMDLTIAEAAARIAAIEPLGAAPDEPMSFLWRAPGLGGHIRTQAAERCVLAATLSDDSGARRTWETVTTDDLLRTWVYGFAVRYMVELLNDGDRLY